MEYQRPYLTFTEQLELMEARGLDCSAEYAADVLSRIGYYRLSGYTYPFRRMLPPSGTGETPYQHREAEFIPGYSLDDALDLYTFDHHLRILCFDAIKAIEIGLRVQIAYVLGKRDRFGYLNRSALHQQECNRHSPRDSGDMFDNWLDKFNSLKSKAKSEDFVRHYDLKYGGKLPVWVAVEVLDFGSLIRLFSLLRDDDKNTIARKWGVKNGKSLHNWLLALGVVRNTSAHHGRIWNRNFTYPVGRFVPEITGPELHHTANPLYPRKIYVRLALLAYLVVRIDPRSNWPRSVKTRVKKFPVIQGLSPEHDMGFPSGWAEEPLWGYVPVHQR